MGGLWIGFGNGAGLLKNGQLTVYTEGDGFPSGSASGFAEQADGTVWVGTTCGLARLEGARWKRIGRDGDYRITKAPVTLQMVDSARMI